MPLAEKCLKLFPKRQRLVKLRPPKTCFQRRQWHPTPVLLPGKSHGRRSLVNCSPWGREESNTTERLHFHFSLSCTGEGKEMATQSSVLAWRLPGTGEPGGLPSLGSCRVRHNWSDLAAAAAFFLLVFSSLIPLWSESRIYMISILLNLLCFMNQNMEFFIFCFHFCYIYTWKVIFKFVSKGLVSGLLKRD